MTYTAIWVVKDSKLKNFDEQSFRDLIPLELLGLSLGDTRMNLVILEGADHLSSGYLSTLSRWFNIINYEKEFKNIVARYPNIDKFYSHYERNCFLRWIAFREIHKEGQFWHLDSDIVLNVPLGEIQNDTRGKTFVLQRCPAFVSISDADWFRSYEDELLKLEKDIVGYSKIADDDRETHETYRNPIGSDQDLIAYLVSIKALPQDKIPSGRFHYMENLLTLKMWSVKREVNRLAFIHWQGTLCHLANIYLFLHDMRLRGRITKWFVYHEFFGSKVSWSLGSKVAWKLARWFGYELPRTRLIQSYGSDTRLPDFLNFLRI